MLFDFTEAEVSRVWRSGRTIYNCPPGETNMRLRASVGSGKRPGIGGVWLQDARALTKVVIRDR
jgi:hypothetical protein